MNEEFKKLKAMLHANEPRPPGKERREAISAAMEAFDDHYQGEFEEEPHKKQVTNNSRAWQRWFRAPLAYPQGALAGGVALVFIIGALAYLNRPASPTMPTPVAQVTELEPEGDEAIETFNTIATIEAAKTLATGDIAETALSQISGTVVDRATGEPLAATIVSIEGTVMSAIANDQGEYSISNVPPETYTVEANGIGYRTVRAVGATVNADSATTLYFELEANALGAPAAEVVAARELVQRSWTIVGTKSLPKVKLTDLADVTVTKTTDPEAIMAFKNEAFSDLESSAEVYKKNRTDYPMSGKDVRLNYTYRDQGRDRFTDFDTNPVKMVAEAPVSTFSIDVDAASYSTVRARLKQVVLPQKNAVRVEELINYFSYNYPLPTERDAPFAVSVSLMPTPWNDDTRLMQICIKGYALDTGTPPRTNLVFLIDTSGSMKALNKLPLLINSLKLLVGALAPEDRVAIVTYAGSAGTVLEPTPVAERSRILTTLEGLRSAGRTAGGEGLRQAYRLAEQNFIKDGVNRVILATDGDFNVGITDQEELTSFIEQKRKSGVFLSVLGFGMGNYNDALMQSLAQNGNGNAIYIDNLSEAQKALVEEATSMLFPIAKDVKIQVEFNPARISEYRLIGYETRMLNREDFKNDQVDAGEIGAGHTVTAIYEVTPVGSRAERIEPLRYQQEKKAKPTTDFTEEFAFVKIRYKLPKSETSDQITQSVTAADAVDRVEAAPHEARFAAAVAAFGQVLRGGQYTGDYSYEDVIALAQGAKGADTFGYRAEFIGLCRLAQSAAAMEPLR